MRAKTIILQIGVSSAMLISACVILFEIPPRFSRMMSNQKNNVLCKNTIINNVRFSYSQCPNAKYIRSPGADSPEMTKAVTCTDKYGGRISCNEVDKDFALKDYHLFIIGDSFIQADELPYEETIYGLINKKANGKKTYGFGMASWNSSQFMSAVNAINEKGKHYDIFLFWNDFAPNYERSRLGQSLVKSIDKKNNYNLIMKIFQSLASKSFTIQKINQLTQRLDSADQEKRDLFWDNYINSFKDNSICTKDLPGFRGFHPVMQDYLSLSSKRECWDLRHEKAYDLVIKDLKNIISKANDLNSTVRFVLHPAGFSFPNENSPGREAPGYGFKNNFGVSLTELRHSLKKDLGGYLVDIEDSMAKELRKVNGTCQESCEKNYFFFGHDGHFNANAHSFIYDILYK